MKKFFESVKNKATKAVAKIKAKFICSKGEGYVDTAVKIIIAVVVGAVVLGGLYALFDNLILPRLTTEINKMFNFGG